MVLSILGRGLSWHANEPSLTVYHCRGCDHPGPDLAISALAEATEHGERGWRLFWLDQRHCAVCFLIIIIIIITVAITIIIIIVVAIFSQVLEI